jgi:peptidoglycan hydrolase-like protein with peptidoglycan-binding domain
VSAEWTLCPDPIVRPVILGRATPLDPRVVVPYRIAQFQALRTQYGKFLRQRYIEDLFAFQTGNCRNIDGTTPATPGKHSEHAHWHTVDIRPAQNQVRNDGVLKCEFDMFGLDDGVKFLRAFLHDGWFRWGGTWSSSLAVARDALARNGQKIRDGKVDAMHFELELSPQQLGAATTLKLTGVNRGLALRCWKAQLKRLGFLTSTVDGIFDGDTDKATKEFQRSKNLRDDGVVGRDTWAAAFA